MPIIPSINKLPRYGTRYSQFLLILSLVFNTIVPLISASQYDQMVNLFNPNGDLLQVEYAERASNKGNPLICFTHEINHTNSTTNTTETGILLLTRSQPFDQLLDRQSIDKVEKVDDDIWVAFSGLAGDGRSLIRASRSFSSNFRRLFGYAPSVVALAKHIGDTQHEATLKGDRRPLGVQLVYMGFDCMKPVLYSTGPSGLVSQWTAIALGDKSDSLMRKLEQDHTVLKKGSLSQGAVMIFESLQSIRLHSDDDSSSSDEDADDEDSSAKGTKNSSSSKKTQTKSPSKPILTSSSTDKGSLSSSSVSPSKPCDVYLLRKIKSRSANNNNNNSYQRVIMSSQKGITSLTDLNTFLSKHISP